CEEHAPPAFDFLKVDVEGAEADVLLNGDWGRFRPRVIVVEALAPYTLMPAWQSWEPFLTGHGYRHIWFDSLNRYYLAEEAAGLGGNPESPTGAPSARCLRRDHRQRAIPHRLRSNLGELQLVGCASRRFGLPGPRRIRYTACWIVVAASARAPRPSFS